MSIARMDAWVMTVVCCLVEKEDRAGHRQKEYNETYGRIVENMTKQLIGNGRKLVQV